MLYLVKIKRMVKKKFVKSGHVERYIHTLGVAKMAKFLVKKYNVCKKSAIIAAYLHDYMKYDSIDEIKKLLNSDDYNECMNCKVLFHSYGSAEFYKKYIGSDNDIYNAIKNHVFGRVGMSKLEEIILISDYTEENRKYDNCIKCREILLNNNLNEAIYYSTKKTIELLIKDNKKPHSRQLEVLKYYEGVIKC